MGIFSKFIDSYEIKDGVCTVALNKRGKLDRERVKKIFDIQEVKECKEIVVKIGDKVRYIGERAFEKCTSLKTIEIPATVTKIGRLAFYNCISLSRIEVEKQNTAYRSINGDLYSKDGTILLQYAVGKDEKSFTVPKCVTNIGGNAFSSNTSLNRITIPDSVTSINYYAFNGCENLVSIDVDENNEEYQSVDGVLYTKDGKYLVRYPEGKNEATFVVPEGIEKICSCAFHFCKNLESIGIPEGATEIFDWVFFRCTNLTSITLPESLWKVGSGTFECCTALESIVLPAYIKTMGEDVFAGCTNLKIYSKDVFEPDEWVDWNPEKCPVVWSYEPKEHVGKRTND